MPNKVTKSTAALEDFQWAFPKNIHSFTWRIASRFTIAAVGLISKVIMKVLNRSEVVNQETLIKAIENRPANVPLLTVANHASCFDDPGIWGTLPLRIIFRYNLMRWSLAAHNICFTNRLHSEFFARGRCVPIVRGAGVFQKGVDFCLEQLNAGQWVHIFPEGRVNEKKEFIRFKWGVGRIVAESEVTPIIIPMWHIGMDDVLPNKTPYVPTFGNFVLVNVGNPLDLSHLISELKRSGACAEITRMKITERIQEELYRLKEHTELLYEKMKKGR